MKSVKTWKKLLSVVLSSAIIVTTLAPGAVVSAEENPSVQQGAEILNFDGTNADISSADQTENSSENAPAEQNADDAVTPDEGSNAQDTPDAAAEADDSAAVKEQQSESAPAENEAQTKAAADTNLYQDGSICIYNEQQLRAIGNGAQVYEGDASADTFGTGAALTKEDGSALTYAADGTYTLMNDIPLTKGSAWTLPEGFAGAFNDAEVTEDAPLYDAETDTIYVYHQYQLATINDPEALKTVMSKDMIAKDFGVGQVVYEDADQAIQLEYTDEHNYVVSKEFTEEMPELTATEVQADVTDQQGERDFVGQVYKEIDGKTYILIGNEYQLREIGKGTQVTPMLYVKTTVGIDMPWPYDDYNRIIYTPYYPGDADINLKTGLDSAGEERQFSYLETKKQELFKINYDDDGLVGDLLGPLGSVLSTILKDILGSVPVLGNIIIGLLEPLLKDLVGPDNSDIVIADKALQTSEEDQGFISVADDLQNQKYKDLKYTSDANYIVFRDINLSASLEGDIGSDNGAGTGNGEADNWDPIMLSGDMLGQKNMDPETPVTISNITVTQSGALDISKYIGIGFFGTISNQLSEENIGLSAGTVSVKNLNLETVTVDNNSKEVDQSQTVVDNLATVLGTVLGSVLDILGGLLEWVVPGLDLKLGDVVKGILADRAAQPDTFATGAFAGRIIGDVEVTGCSVSGATVTNDMNMTGGFVGTVTGMTEYEGLGTALKEVLGTLQDILDVIPGLGLGDLVEILLRNDDLLKLEDLVPTGYKKARISDCHVSLTSVGSAETKFNGGFAGAQIGADISGSSVSGLTNVQAKEYAGGFTGITRDAVIEGLLTSLDIELANLLDPSSTLTNCTVNEPDTAGSAEEITGLTVSSQTNYAGGFTGAAANSNISMSAVNNLSSVIATGNYAGGFAGRTTLGTKAAKIGDIDETDNGLLGTITSVLTGVLGKDGQDTLLNVAGVSPTVLDGCNVEGTGITVSADNYAGGFFGEGDGTTMPGTNKSSIKGLTSVTAKTNYAGGVAGKIVPANAAGIVDSALGLINAIPFSLNNIEVNSENNGWSVTATGDYSGGAIGQATGGTANNILLKDITEVKANNYAGGFIGLASPGNLAESGGLDILGLISVDHLLSLGKLLPLTINNGKVEGNNLTVKADGKTEAVNYFAGGFIGQNSSSDISNSSVTGLMSVSASTKTEDESLLAKSYAGGFAAMSQVGGLAEIGDENTVDSFLDDKNVLNLHGLLEAVQYLIPKYDNCYVEFAAENNGKPQVNAAVAGGFIGEMQGGKINVPEEDTTLTVENKYAVRNAKYIEGTYYAGGFAGRVYAGGFAEAGGLDIFGTKVLSINDLASVLQVYIPEIRNAGVSSRPEGSEDENEFGLKVRATNADELDVDSGTAGGYIGLARGTRISDSDVCELASGNQEENRLYAVEAPNYAGGYAGKADIGSAAAVGDQLSILKLTGFDNLIQAVDSVESKFESCDVYGRAGGFNVKSTGGSAGGYAAVVEGSNFIDCNSYNFEYIEGVVSAGGYAGTIQPGNVASIVGNTEILAGLISAENLLGVAQTFIPRIWNSETTAVPCGGYVIASGTSNGSELRGLAGGYVGYNLGGQIIGNETDESKGKGAKTAAAIRIRSVEGNEFAGGFTGLMETANAVDTGNLEILWGLIQAASPLQAVSAVYPTEENTKVTGPLDSMTVDLWTKWYNSIGKNSTYASEFADINEKFSSLSEGEKTDQKLNELLQKYVYGYTVETKEKDNDINGVDSGGSAGGYVGRMEGGSITNGYAEDIKSVEAYRSAGGFAGEMITGTVANVGEITIGDLNVVDGLEVVETFVPVIKTSKVTGYQSGFTVEATAESDNVSVGNAGGFVGYATGAQIKEQEDDTAAIVKNLKSVTAHKNVGGFSGIMQAGTAVGLDVTSSSGLLNQILGLLINQKNISDLVGVLQATRTVVNSAEISGYNSDSENGENVTFSVIGDKGQKADFAGGFAGKLTGALIGDESSETKDSVVIKGLKSVAGGKHVGGFFGLADVDGLVEVAEDSETSILDLIGLGNVDVLNAFRTYIYSATVNGAENSGLSIYAKESTDSGNVGVIDRVVSFFAGDEAVDQTDKDGNAGGFGGSLKDSSVVNCEVNNLNRVNALTYAGGFIGFTGKSGVVDVDNVDVLDKLLGASAGVADIFGSQVKDSNVNGSDKTGYIIRSKDGEECIAGGFIGYGDLARVDNCHAQKLKQVYSDQIAGGFIGKTSFAYLAEVDAGSNELLNPILSVVNQLLKYLYADELQDIELIQVTLPEPLDKVLNLEVLNDNNVLSVTLLGLTISVGLVKGDGTTSDVAQIHIGDSYIEVKCHNDPDGKNYIDNNSNISIGLIKANRTRVGDSSVSGISIGYDVFGGGAGNEKDGTHNEGYAGGFVGYNDEGLFETNQMYYADTIRGTKGLVGEFSGQTSLETVYEDFNNLDAIEGTDNIYRVYRKDDRNNLTQVYSNNGKLLNDPATENPDDAKAFDRETIDDTSYYVYGIEHRKDGIKESSASSLHKAVWASAYQKAKDKNAEFSIYVYVSDAQADLMLGTPTYAENEDPDYADEEMQDPCDEEIQLTVQKIWIDDEGNPVEKPDKVVFEVHQNGKPYTPKEATEPLKIVLTPENAEADPNSWVTTVSVPFKDSEGNEYSYSVEEVGDAEDNYVTIYPAAEEGSHLICVINFQASELVQGDSVVIDYGLPVQIDVLANDRINDEAVGGGQLEDVATEEQVSAGTISEEEAKGAETATGKFGIATVEKNDDNSTTGNIVYTPTTMQMTSFDKFTYGVGLSGTAVKDVPTYVYGSLSIIPATEIYYEDNFESTDENSVGRIHYVDGSTTTAGSNHGTWRTVGETDDGFQDTDRPGTNELKEAVDNVYGNDTHYTDDTEYSNGSSHVVTVSPKNLKSNGGTAPSAWFTFTGTGFDLISMTAFDTGTIRVRIHEGNSLSGKVLDTWTVNTYYGYTYDPNAASDEDKWSLVGSGQAGDQLYQIPIVKSDKLAYGTYTVELLPTYAKNQDVQNKGYYDLYIDAVRIYNPANPADENYSKIEDIYEQDGEVNPQFMELRDLLIDASEAEDSSEEAEIANEGIVFIDGKAEDVNLSEYVSYGPKNEVYLAANQAIAFYIEADGKPDTIQLSAKLAMGGSAKLSLACAVQESGDDTAPLKWTKYHANEVEITSAYDLHYSLSEQVQWKETGDGKFITRYPIVVSNVSGKDSKSVISLTDLNWTGSSGVDESGEKLPITLMAYTDSSAAEAAYSLVRMSSERTVTVQYQDQDGNQLAEPAVQTVTDGAAYNVSAFIDLQINGYIQKEIQGDPIQGTADADKLITVIYEKEVPKVYTVTVSYVDKEGKALAESYVQENVSEGTIYDLKEQTEKTIDGYEISEITGDAVQGTVSGDVNVTVIYEKEPSVFDNFVDAVVDGFNKVVDGINKVVDWVSNVIASIFPWE